MATSRTNMPYRTTPRPRGAPARGSGDARPHPPQWSRNSGMPLELDWVREARVNRSAVERRAETLPRRRTVKTVWQAAWLLRAVTLMDLTTLQGDDTPGRVQRLCAKARRPVRQDLLDQLDLGDLELRVAAVCVYHALVETAVAALDGSDRLLLYGVAYVAPAV